MTFLSSENIILIFIISALVLYSILTHLSHKKRKIRENQQQKRAQRFTALQSVQTDLESALKAEQRPESKTVISRLLQRTKHDMTELISSDPS